MADIELNVEVRKSVGSGSARAARQEGKVPGVLYGGPRGAVPIAVSAHAFGKALYTGKLLGHLVKLRYGNETQSVIAKEVQFHPVSDKPMHFDLYRVDEHQLVKIAVPVHFRNQESCIGLKRGGTLNVSRHEVELWVRADHIPDELIVDLSGLRIGDTVRVNDIELPPGAEPVIADRDFVIATVAGTSAQMSEDAAADQAVAEAQSAESQAEAAAEQASED